MEDKIYNNNNTILKLKGEIKDLKKTNEEKSSTIIHLE